jgi:hypothetical protein
MTSTVTRQKIKERLGGFSLHKEARFYKQITSALVPFYKPVSSWCFSRTAGMIDEYVVQHEEYAGAGAGAFGYIGGRFYATSSSVELYLQQVNSGRLPLIGTRRFNKHEQARYTLLMDLFGDNFSLRRLYKRYGPVNVVSIGAELLMLLISGALTRRRGRTTLTRRGRYYTVVLMREFFSSVNNFRLQAEETSKQCMAAANAPGPLSDYPSGLSPRE